VTHPTAINAAAAKRRGFARNRLDTVFLPALWPAGSERGHAWSIVCSSGANLLEMRHDQIHCSVIGVLPRIASHPASLVVFT
jgi:hypothetical protein